MDGLQTKTPAKPGLTYPFDEQVPEQGETTEIIPGLYWVRMRLPFALEWINLWLIDDGERGWTIVDTGMPSGCRHFVQMSGSESSQGSL